MKNEISRDQMIANKLSMKIAELTLQVSVLETDLQVANQRVKDLTDAINKNNVENKEETL
jgi:predicted  nucleic acid-binding Zn-ribbon protein